MCAPLRVSGRLENLPGTIAMRGRVCEGALPFVGHASGEEAVVRCLAVARKRETTIAVQEILAAPETLRNGFGHRKNAGDNNTQEITRLCVRLAYVTVSQGSRYSCLAA